MVCVPFSAEVRLSHGESQPPETSSGAPLRFLGIDPTEGDPAVSILPVAYDGTSTWRKGADRGPAALLEASGEVELFDLPTASEPFRAGIETLPTLVHEGSPEQLAERVETRIAALLSVGRLPVILGGEHSVSIGGIRAAAAHAASTGAGFGTLQLDAHGDTRETYRGSGCNHACVMARAREVGQIVQVGIRAIDRGEHETMDRARVFTADRIREADRRADDDWMDDVIELLPERVYLTIDLDAFDSGIMPATGTPEPGGLDWWTIDRLVRRVARARRIVAFDVVELLPHPAHWACDFLAAKLVHRVLAEVLAARGGPSQSSST